MSLGSAFPCEQLQQHRACTSGTTLTGVSAGASLEEGSSAAVAACGGGDAAVTFPNMGCCWHAVHLPELRMLLGGAAMLGESRDTQTDRSLLSF